MESNELRAVLNLHAKWICGEDGGVIADLRWSYLRGANLIGADLIEADLRGANLSGADLPNGYRIALLCFGGWSVSATPERTSIGCQTHPNEDWLRWTPDDVAEMHSGAKAWWTNHREAVCAVIRDVMREVGK